jgi:SAM-dependent methyltransferase
MTPNPGLMGWQARENISGQGKKALVIGCGLGDDAEALDQIGFEVAAFDISPTAVEWCHKRFPSSKVHYTEGNILTPPPDWQGQFDFVLEIFTLQVLPPDLRQQAQKQIASLLAPGGTLLLIARGRNPEDDPGAMPWPLTRDELAMFLTLGLKEIRFEDYLDQETPPVRRFRVEYRR